MFLFVGKVNAQQRNPLYDLKPFHMGFYINPQIADFKVVRAANYLENDSVKHLGIQTVPGFGLGFIMDFKLGKDKVGDRLNLRILPGINFVQRNMTYTFTDRVVDINVESINGNLPILLKYKSVRYNNTRFYTIAGVTFTRDFGSEEKAQRAPNKELVALKASRIQYEFGIGFDFYFELFKFSPEIRMSRGITNALSTDPHIWASTMDGIYTRLFQIAIQFEGGVSNKRAGR